MRKENGRLKEQLAKDVTNLIIMKSMEAKLEQQVMSLKKEITELK